MKQSLSRNTSKQEKVEGKPITVCAQVCFVVNPEYPWLGASPDFLICDVNEESLYGIGEVKCPFSKRDMFLREACEDNTKFYLHFDNGKLTMKQDHAYYYQLQGSMATLHLKWSDFVVFTNKDLHVEGIYFDNQFWKSKMLPELNSFHFEYLTKTSG